MKISLIAGDLLQLLMISIGLVIAIFYEPSWIPVEGDHLILINIVVFLVAGGLFWYFSHCISHHVIGAIFGIKFKYYFTTRSGIKNLPGMKKIGQMLVTLGIKIDHSKSKKSRVGYTLMYASGAIASMTTPYITVLVAWLRGLVLEASILLIIWTLNLVFTMITSPIAGDFMKARKAWKKYQSPSKNT